MSLTVLTQASIDNLRAIVSTGQNILSLPFDDMVDEFGCNLIDIDVDYVEDIALLMPDGKYQGENGDLENCLLMKKVFPNLTDLQATDERLWATLCMREYKEYALLRWPQEKAENNVLIHWFANTTRSLMRDNAISRLWWYQNICSRISEANLRENLERLFFRADYRSSMLERNTSSSVTNVVAAILKITSDYEKRGVNYHKQKFRDFMMKVDLLAGRYHLAALTIDQIVDLLDPIYAETHT